MKKHRLTIISAFVLTAFTAYAALDTFVIPSSYQTNATAVNTSMFEEFSEEETQGASGSADASAEAVQVQVTEGAAETESSGELYQDGNIRISMSEYEVNNTRVYVADVTLTSAQYLKTAFADDTYGRNITATTSDMAEENNAVLAVNGDYYGARETGYVIRNGVLRSSSDGSEVLCVYADGTMDIVDSTEVTAEELVQNGVWQAITFGPGLIEDGQVSVDENDEVGRAKASNPRTAVGMIDPLHYIFVVSDGRTDESEGLSLYELACFMQEQGAKVAYNLDGGGSSTMVFNGTLINNPTTGGSRIKERSVSDIVYIG